MGNYNPSVPAILGQEWVPILNDTVLFGPQETAAEYGSTFVIDSSENVSTVRFTIPPDMPNVGSFGYQGTTANIYQTGAETSAGPVRRVLIPVNNGSVTGANASFTGGSIARALMSVEDNYHVNLGISTSQANSFTVYFDTNRYAQLLQGKRVLAVNILLSADMDLPAILENLAPDGSAVIATRINSVPFVTYFSASNTFIYNRGFDINFDSFLGIERSISRIPLGSVNPLWNSGSVFIDDEALSYTYADLQRFEISASGRYELQFLSSQVSSTGAAFTSFMQFRYMAMEVLYCEENRVATGGLFLDSSQFPGGWTIGQNPVIMRHPVTRAATPTLSAGPYVATVTRPQFYAYEGAFPAALYRVAGTRELYSVPTVEGSVIKVPFPFDDSAEGKVYERETTHFVPQLTVHTSSGVITDVNPYGLRAEAQVYGSVTATQNIQDVLAGGSTTYDKVRFIARRFGDTTVPLLIDSTGIPSSYAQITSAQFDLLPEIIDGWKEVTLDLSAAATMGTGTNPTWRFSATGEYAGNRWEVLGAAAPAISGIPGNLLAQSPQQLGLATYGAATGTTYTLSWINGTSPLVSATTSDSNADAFLIFSKTPPAVSGLTVTTPEQSLVTVDSLCEGVTSDCIPTAMDYNRIGWTRLNAAAQDDFGRTVSGGWGTSDSGLAWTIASGTAGEFTVNGSKGVITPANAGRRNIVMASGGPDQEVQFLFNAMNMAVSGAMTFGTIMRYTDANNFYYSDMLVDFSVGRSITLRVAKVVAGLDTQLGTAVTSLVIGTDAGFWVKTRVAGSSIFSKIWGENQEEPATWMLWFVDTALTTGNSAGITMATTFAVPFVGQFDQVSMSPPDFGAIDLQRFDGVDLDWSTIMTATNPAVTGFSDFEARVGMYSAYRVRRRNSYDFTGNWSVPVSGMIPSPGVTGADTALLLMTSNSDQTGNSNLAYSAAWESDPTEEFTWPEGSDVTFQRMYAKDYATAFHPLERGGERFTRTILVNSLGIPEAVSLNGFRSIRDLGWADLPYVCVRDELGNRWYAAILVPSGNRRRIEAKGMLEMVNVSVVEVSTIPYPVDP